MNNDSPLALYYQLKESFISNILSAVWPPDSKMPSERELCDAYGVSRVTVRKALDELVQGGFIYRKQGKGTFVKQKSLEQKLSKFYSFSEEIRKQGMAERAKMLLFEEHPADSVIAAELHILPGEMVFKVKRLRTIDDTPYAVETSYLPAALLPGLTQQAIERDGLYNTMRNFGVFPVRAIERLKAVTLRATTARLLQSAAGEAAVHLTRNTFSATQSVEFCESVILGKMFSYTIELS